MTVNEKMWQITKFAKVVSDKYQEKTGKTDEVHYNTLDKWFKEMEHKRVHYIQRAVDKKVYDELDLEIGVFIMEQRASDWRLEAIFNSLAEYKEVRAFPDDFDDASPMTDEAQVMRLLNQKMDIMVQTLREEMQLEMRQYKDELAESFQRLLPDPNENADVFREVAESLEKQKEETQELLNKQKKELEESFQKQLPVAKTEGELRAEKTDTMITYARKRSELEKQAIGEWKSLPVEETTKKAGLFRKEEDLLKRDAFIRKYIDEHIEKALLD